MINMQHVREWGPLDAMLTFFDSFVVGHAASEKHLEQLKPTLINNCTIKKFFKIKYAGALAGWLVHGVM